jgi:adenine-specific DNA-methyltransferase
VPSARAGDSEPVHGFFALAILQMAKGGEIVIIIPRSFCNGPYYRPFRDMMLAKCSVDVIHVFDSRSHAFKDDEVLQENIILKLTVGGKQGKVLLSFSHDSGLRICAAERYPLKTSYSPTTTSGSSESLRINRVQ